MRKVITIGVLSVASVFVAYAHAAQQDGASAEGAPELQALQEAPPPIAVTARGRGIVGEGWNHDAESQKKVDEPNVDLKSIPERAIMKVGLTGALSSAVMDAQADDEGNLVRIHVDRPETRSGVSSDRIVVLGFYDDLSGDSAVHKQRYQCVECEEITVCGVNPMCSP